MKSITQIFATVRKGLEYVNKASKILRSVELVGEHFSKLIDDLEEVWGIKHEPKEEGAEV